MRNLLTGLVGLIALFVFYSCQKEVSLEYDSPAKGPLQGNGGDCLPKLVGGSYIAGKALNDSNFLEITVDVLTPGPYIISTDSINGYIFKGSGTFANTGANTIRLLGSGIPVNGGVNNFTVVFDSSYCEVPITVLPAGSTGGPAVFTLEGSPAACSAFDLGGTYYKDSTLDSRHSVKVNVNITAVGAYTITTNVANGYSFSATGTFGATGPAQVILLASGKPLAVGTDNFTVTAGASTCAFPVTVTTPSPTPPTGDCGATPQGTYTVGTALSAANTIVVPHTYAAAGSYTVTTNSVNGYSFSSAPVTATAGASTNITLTGTGTPTAAGTNTFTINFGDGQTCTFDVTVNPATSVVNNDYFPTTLNSWWSYDIGADTIKVTNTGNTTVTGSSNTYQRFVTSYQGSPVGTAFYRKDANGFYYQSIDTGGMGFGAAGITSSTPRLELLFLKNTLATGDSLISDINATALSSMGPVPTVIRYKYKVINSNVTLTINGKTFTNVYQLRDFMEIGFMGSFDDAGLDSWDYFYAKGIGLIRVDDGTDQQDIRFWQVN